MCVWVRAAVVLQVSHIHVHEGEKGVVEAIWLLFSSIICVPLVVKLLPGGSPVLGYLLGGAIVGPHALGLIQDVEVRRALGCRGGGGYARASAGGARSSLGGCRRTALGCRAAEARRPWLRHATALSPRKRVCVHACAVASPRACLHRASSTWPSWAWCFCSSTLAWSFRWTACSPWPSTCSAWERRR